MPTLFITGANRGLGLGLTHGYLQRNWRVIAVARSESEPLNRLANDPGLLRLQGDVSDPDFLRRLPDELAAERIDLLINNAGIMATTSSAGTGRTVQGLADFDRDEWRRVLDINVVSPMHVTHVLLPLLRDGSTVVTISSSMGSIASTDTAGWAAYRTSKSAVNACMKSASIELAPRGIIAIALHPGWVRTDMGGAQADLSIEESIAGMMRVLDKLERGHSGRFLAWDGTELPY